MLAFTKGFLMLASRRSNPYKHPRGVITVMRPFCLVESCTLDAAAMQVRSLFTSFTFCNIIFSCSLILKEKIFVVPFASVSLIEIPATINLYYLV